MDFCKSFIGLPILIGKRLYRFTANDLSNTRIIDDFAVGDILCLDLNWSDYTTVIFESPALHALWLNDNVQSTVSSSFEVASDEISKCNPFSANSWAPESSAVRLESAPSPRLRPPSIGSEYMPVGERQHRFPDGKSAYSRTTFYEAIEKLFCGQSTLPIQNQHPNPVA